MKNVAKSSLEQSSLATKQLMSAKDPQEFFALIATYAQPNVEKALAYGRQVASIASRSHAEFISATEAQITEMNRKVTRVVDEVAKNAPASSERAIALVKSAIGNANGYAQVTKTAHQAVDVLEANLSMAADQVAQVAEKREAALRNNALTGPMRSVPKTKLIADSFDFPNFCENNAIY